MSHKRKIQALVISASALAFAMFAGTHASAQSLDNDYWIDVQGYYPKIDTNVRVTADVANAIGTDIDLERDLSLDDREILPAVSIGSRFGKVVVGFDFFRLNRDGVVELGRDITFDDVTFPLDARVESGFDSDIYRLTVGYSFIQKPGLEVGAALGLHATDFTVSISGEVAGNEFEAESRARRRSVLAPLPTVGLYGTWRIGRRFEANERIDYLSLNIDDYDGELINAQAGINYSITRNIAIGAAYRYVRYRVGVEKDLWYGRMTYELNGPALIAQVSF